MTYAENPKLVIPIQASHVREALCVARVDQDAFRETEMAWLKAHNSFLGQHIGELFGKMTRSSGLEDGYALLAGCTLAHYAVRECGDNDPEAYELARKNYHRNLQAEEADLLRLGLRKRSPDESWNTEVGLLEIFGDEDLTTVIMDVNHDVARDSVAFTLGCFCLETLPGLTPATT